MSCRVCGQWNPKDASRCAFCENELEGVEDTTGHGKPVYIAQDSIELVRSSAGAGSEEGGAPAPTFAISLKTVELIVTGVLIAFVIGLSILFRC